MFARPYRVLAITFGVAVVCFLISASGQSGSFWSSGPSWLGAIGWVTFLAAFLALVVEVIVLALRGLRRRNRRGANPLS